MNEPGPDFPRNLPKSCCLRGTSRSLPKLCYSATQPVLPSRQLRRIPPLSGMALEVLGHAIEYLADEYVLHAGMLPAVHVEDPQIRAIQVLMAASRSVYGECPLVPTLRERLSRLLSR
jgi:hypothetical protein